MVLGEKLWEGKGKTMGMVVKSVGAEGATIEFTWVGDLKGVGRAKGFDGNVTVTSTTLIGPSRAGSSRGQGIFTTNTGELAVLNASGHSKVEANRSEAVGQWSFIAMSQKLAWMNTLITVVAQEGDSMWQEFDISIHEWK